MTVRMMKMIWICCRKIVEFSPFVSCRCDAQSSLPHRELSFSVFYVLCCYDNKLIYITENVYVA